MKYLGHEEAIGLMMWNNSDPMFSLRLSFVIYFFKEGALYSHFETKYRANTGKGFTRADLVTELQRLKVIF